MAEPVEDFQGGMPGRFGISGLQVSVGELGQDMGFLEFVAQFVDAVEGVLLAADGLVVVAKVVVRVAKLSHELASITAGRLLFPGAAQASCNGLVGATDDLIVNEVTFARATPVPGTCNINGTFLPGFRFHPHPSMRQRR